MSFATAKFEENKDRGLLICGINWGGNSTVQRDPEPLSFFSDRSVNSYPYRNRLLRWFELWGHPLLDQVGQEGAFERSIVQSNWLPDQASSMRGRNVMAECIEQRENFFKLLSNLSPRLILLCGSSLLRALNQPLVLKEAEKYLGAASSAEWKKKDVDNDGKKLKRFSVGFQSFANADVIAIPHPTGCSGLSDLYMASYKEDIGPILKRFKAALG